MKFQMPCWRWVEGCGQVRGQVGGVAKLEGKWGVWSGQGYRGAQIERHGQDTV